MNATIAQLEKLATQIRAAREALVAIPWDGLADSGPIGAHLVALESQLGDATGRVGTLLAEVSRTGILIYEEAPHLSEGGKLWLTASGLLSANRNSAAPHSLQQFDAVVADNWIVRPAKWELA